MKRLIYPTYVPNTYISAARCAALCAYIYTVLPDENQQRRSQRYSGGTRPAQCTSHTGHAHGNHVVTPKPITTRCLPSLYPFLFLLLYTLFFRDCCCCCRRGFFSLVSSFLAGVCIYVGKYIGMCLLGKDGGEDWSRGRKKRKGGDPTDRDSGFRKSIY